ncbi:serine/threonine-protein phosphatase 1 regulatory subunit 10-like [Danaus plexippus]|uniref:serine/threonine-protein phosphatase 1 regulatory subunit 10-like n=1 Tax=Danaus plexippus TaxID=13037 RepID=UPI002AB2F5C2|nr:serine/threonine-protein phosphatase 1 regulatory subunit 10-like [Danaus plexippus]
MPRIDPIQLLNCLSVLLSPDGGIKSRDEVPRLVRLMTKFSKKLVSKCIYIQILKCTEIELLGLFMGSKGWRLVHMWLTESIVAKNWPLVRELLELLLLCPVDIERLKTNNCPKLVKELSKDGNHSAIRALATKLVEQWLKTVKGGEQVVPMHISEIQQIITDSQLETKLEDLKNDASDNEKDLDDRDSSNLENNNKVEVDEETLETPCKIDITDKDEQSMETEVLPVLKITLKNGKQILSQVEDDSKSSEDSVDKDNNKEKQKSRSKDKSEKSSSSSSSKSSSSKHSSRSSSSDKRSNHKESSSKHSSKDKSRDKDKRTSHSSRSKSSSSSSSSSRRSSSSSSKLKDEKSSKDKSKDKDSKQSSEKSDDKVQTAISKLGKIPKLSDVKKEKLSISIEVRKPDEPKPKTVKTFNSKFRKHGLEEEMKPPPSRATLLSNKKPPPALPPTVSIPKRPSPVHNDTPPEKKPKPSIDLEKPGSIKLIPPKPKPMVLQESDMFMDALNASATNKKEPKKRKRRTSGSKDGNSQNDGSPPHTPTGVTSPNGDSKSVPPRFYQDTLDEEDNKDKVTDKNENEGENSPKAAIKDKSTEDSMETEPHTLTVNGIKGVLCYHKRKGPKKSIRWKPDSELEEIQYFELDETERVNVTKTFTDMKHLERINERDAFQKARNLSNDDIMEERTSWRPLIPLDTDGQIQIEYGKNSKEKDIQAIRQKGTLQPLYFHKAMIPDSPHEPDVETHTYAEPTVIPLEDVTGNQDNISDFRNMPWPEPKGNAPPTSNNNLNVPSMFPPNMSQYPNNYPNPQFPGGPPGFQGPPMMSGEWQNGVPPMLPNGMPGPIGNNVIGPGAMPPGSMPQGNVPPGLLGPPDNMMMGPDMFGGPNHMFPVPPDGFNMQQNMFPVDFNMSGPPGPDFPGNFRGAIRGRGSGGHWRGKAAGGWDGPPRGRGGGRGGVRKAVCIYFQRKGSCRQGENCTFLHPGVNCPF